MTEEYLQVKAYHWAKRPTRVYLEFDEQGNVDVVHVGKPIKGKEPLRMRQFRKVEKDGEMVILGTDFMSIVVGLTEGYVEEDYGMPADASQRTM